MRVLVLGNGGREAAMLLALQKSPSVQRMSCVPGSMCFHHILAPSEPISLSDFAGIRGFVRDDKIDLTVVGPEAPLVAGIVDDFRSHDLRICGPTKAAARAEASKAWFKELLRVRGIPTAPFEVFNHAPAALRYIEKQGVANIVIKADGLMAGKGVTLPSSLAEAERDLGALMKPGTPGEVVVIEERLFGEECSLITATDGVEMRMFPFAQDYKRVGDGNAGRNTGGMGAHTVDVSHKHAVMYKDLTSRIIHAMGEAGAPYSGFIYPGIIHTKFGPMVLEVNCRFGDPETQVLLPSIDQDFGELCAAISDNGLRRIPELVKVREAVCVVVASPEYPDSSKTDVEIRGIDNVASTGAYVLPAGLGYRNGCYWSNKSGRLLNVVGTGATLAEARAQAYAGVEKISSADPSVRLHYRTDIGR